MNFNIKQKIRLRRVLLGIVGGALGACAYDPSEGVEPSRVPSQSIKLVEPEGQDLIVSQSLVLTKSPGKLRRLILEEGSILSTNGQDLKLDVETIISHNGVIDTSPKDSGSGTVTSETSDGLFHLVAQKGEGHLTLLAHGQDGRPGRPGAPGGTGSRGAQGRNGLSKTVKRCWKIPILVIGRYTECRPVWQCSRKPTSGSRGRPGQQGKPGAEGGRGGDSPPVLLEINDASQIQIQSQVRPGKGGPGGLGGPGGREGKGGAPGALDPKKLCPKAAHGPAGVRGLKGATGPRGQDGIEQPICFRLGGAEIGDCRGFE